MRMEGDLTGLTLLVFPHPIALRVAGLMMRRKVSTLGAIEESAIKEAGNILSAAYLNLAFVAVSEKMIEWFGLEQEPSIWFGFVASMTLLALVMRKG